MHMDRDNRRMASSASDSNGGNSTIDSRSGSNSTPNSASLLMMASSSISRSNAIMNTNSQSTSTSATTSSSDSPTSRITLPTQSNPDPARSTTATPHETRSAPPERERERRTGGLATGQKTPRKNVQWATDTKGEGVFAAPAVFTHAGGSGNANMGGGMHATHHLDEEALDLLALQTLKRKLERHQSAADGGTDGPGPSTSSSHPSTSSSSTKPYKSTTIIPTGTDPFAGSPPNASKDLLDQDLSISSPGTAANTNYNSGFGHSASRAANSSFDAHYPLPAPLYANTNSNGGAGATNRGNNESAPAEDYFTQRGSKSPPYTSNAGLTHAGASGYGYFDSGLSPSGASTPYTPLSPAESSRTSSPLPDEIAAGGPAHAGEHYIERTEVHGLPRPPPEEGMLDENGVMDPEAEEAWREREWRRVERRATRLVRAHARGFERLAGFRGQNALAHMAPEEIDASASVNAAPPVVNAAAESLPPPSHRLRATWHHHHHQKENQDNEKPVVDDTSAAADTNKVQEQTKVKSRGGWRSTLAHPFSAFQRHASSGSASSPSPSSLPGVGASGSREFPEDIEREAARAGSLFGGIHSTSSFGPIGPGRGGGVLSALLALYERPGTGMQSVPQTPDGGSYVEGYDEGGVEGERRAKRRSRRFQRLGRRRSESQGRSNEREKRTDFAEREREESERLPSPPPPSFARTSVNPTYSAPPVSLSISAPTIRTLPDSSRTPSSPPSASTHLPASTSASSSTSVSPRSRLRALPKLTLPERFIPDRRPATARSAAGVFGALVAGAGGALGGPAAPRAVALAPDPKRAGWQLARWSLEEKAPKAGAALGTGHRRGASEAVGTGLNALNLADYSRGTQAQMTQTQGGAVTNKRPGFNRASSAPIIPTFANALANGALVPPESAGASSDLSPASVNVPLAAPPLVMSESAPVVPGYSAGLFGSEESSVATTPGSATPFLFPRGGNGTGAGNSNGLSVSEGPESESKRASAVYSDDATLALSRVGTSVSMGGPLSLVTTQQSTTGSMTPGGTRRKLNLRDMIRPGVHGWATPSLHFRGGETGKYGESLPGTPETGDMSIMGNEKDWAEQEKMEQRRKEEKRRRKRKKAEIYITRHVAAVLQRQEFILKLARALMMFGAPTHRLPAQLCATARVLDAPLSCVLLPDVLLLAFEDAATGTSSVRFIRQAAALDLGKLARAHELYWSVIHDEASVDEASRTLDVLMLERPLYNTWKIVVIGGCCSAAICSVSFSGSFIDSLISAPLGALLVLVQILSVRNELYSNVFEITIATLLSFLSAVFAATHHFCYSAVASSSIVLILPGFIVLNGSLELSSRNIISGAVRLCYAIMYAIFLGFGLSIGGTIYEKITGHAVTDPEDYSCAKSHDSMGPWYQRTPGGLWAFLTVPAYSLFLTLRQQAPWRKKELIITVIISCIGWTCNHFASLKVPGRNDISSAIGALAVGFIANIYGRFFSGNAFIIMITGILFQLPSGLGNGGLITFASQNNTSGSTTSYLSGFRTALQLISVCVGLTVGLGVALVLVWPVPSRKRAGGIFSL